MTDKLSEVAQQVMNIGQTIFTINHEREQTMSDTININGIDYIPAATAQRAITGSRAVIVVDRVHTGASEERNREPANRDPCCV